MATCAKITVTHGLSCLSLCTVGSVLNVFEVASLLLAKKTKLAFDMTLISLAASDLTLAIAVCILLVLTGSLPTVATSQKYMSLHALVIISSSLTSTWHMLFIAIQRLVAVLYPFKVSIWMSKRHCIIILCLLKVISIVAVAPMYYKIHVYERCIIYTPVAVASAIVVCYTIINYRIMSRKRPSISRPASQNLHILMYSVCVTIIFMICTLPYTIHAITHPNTFQFPCYIFYIYLTQSILNPLAYFWKAKKFAICCSMCHEKKSITANAQQQNEIAVQQQDECHGSAVEDSST